MIKINENFLELQNSYLFSTIAKKVKEFQEKNVSDYYGVSLEDIRDQEK